MIPGTGAGASDAAHGFLCARGLDGFSPDPRLLHQPGRRVCRRGCGPAFSARPAVSGDVRVPGTDDGDSGIAPAYVAAYSGLPDLGQLPRGILHGLAGARRLLRRGADPALAEDTRVERAPAMAGSGGLFPGLGPEPQRLPRDPDPVLLPVKRAAIGQSGVAAPDVLGARHVQLLAIRYAAGAASGTPPHAAGG